MNRRYACSSDHCVEAEIALLRSNRHGRTLLHKNGDRVLQPDAELTASRASRRRATKNEGAALDALAAIFEKYIGGTRVRNRDADEGRETRGIRVEGIREKLTQRLFRRAHLARITWVGIQRKRGENRLWGASHCRSCGRFFCHSAERQACFEFQNIELETRGLVSIAPVGI